MAVGDRREDPDTHEAATVVWDGEADRRGTTFSLIGNVATKKDPTLKHGRSRHSQYRSNGPIAGSGSLT